ncbi:NUDIX domain-containing protein [Kitasatospora sp. NPDC059577]|uniref:NUDIX domain-containing protein n=1 Tax=Kitasatospora sp. NPDC059577 TaxID=3346873 RepID=UPI0036C2B1A2
MIKESTASAFVFRTNGDGVPRAALVWHPRLELWLPAGGHVEADESAAEAALREVGEETGLRAELLPGPSLPLPAGFPHSAVPAPWWVVEMDACADNHTREQHVHIDHVFVAQVHDGTVDQGAVHEVRWFTEQEIAEVEGLSEDSRLQVKQLLAMIADGSLRLSA